ncbi:MULTISPECIES: hypothetical protein [Pseudomonas]|uniref:Uncharacterized protein n=1 Tax=Pseudomonas phytophila TaxID=2867264 RepID=A0ABY6FIJ5_9PSED|nr:MULTISPECIES: hypothetical protein [Pseudomonas]MCD5988828.1 hypothetical protein [Pseudomonas quasicaspiana]MDU8359029.1 hypothetical protein [Pseudomonas syringae group sp. J309-1]UXZ97757.1 hypothetical protein K3169_07705 [Pseudomonas phytophila]
MTIGIDGKFRWFNDVTVRACLPNMTEKKPSTGTKHNIERLRITPPRR